MKIRLCVLGFAAFLLMGAWGKAQTPPPSSTVAPGTAPFCAAGVAGLDKSLDLTPSPLLKSVTCGSCSYSSCQGLAANSACYYLGGGTYHLAKCVINSICSDNSPQCDCTNKPPV
jgi:hypothetical protein